MMAKRKTVSDKDLIQLGARVSERVEILGVTLIDASSKYRPADGKPPWNVGLAHRVETIQDGEIVRASVRFALTLESEEPGKGEPIVSISAVFLLRYKLESTSGIEKRHVDAFGNSNGVFNAWPYWREFVQSMTTRMGLPPLTVPVLRIAGKHPNKQRSNKTRPLSKRPVTPRKRISTT